MLEPLANVAKGSVSRYTVLVSPAGNTRFSKPQSLGKDFFTPLPRPAWVEDPRLRSSTPFAALESRELTKQCRRWSCLPSLHSIWCPGQEELEYLDPNPRLRGRPNYLRSNEPASEFLRHFLHHNKRPPLESPVQRRHASVVPRNHKEYAPHAPSKPSPKRTWGASTQPKSTSQRWHPELTHRPSSPEGIPRDKHKAYLSNYSPTSVKFLEYAEDEMLVRNNPQQAHDACSAWLSGTTLMEVNIHSRFAFIQGMLRAIVNYWAQAPGGAPKHWITQLEDLLEVSRPISPFSTYEVWERYLSPHISALKGDIERADALLHDREWCSKHKRQTIEMMNTVIVSLCRTRSPEEVLKYLEDGIDELPALHLSYSWQAPAMKAISDLFRDHPRLSHLIPERTTGFHPAVFLVKKILLSRRDAPKPVPQPWVKETIEAFLLPPDVVLAREIQGMYGTDGLAYQSFLEQNIGTIKKEDRAVQLSVLKELLNLYPGYDAFYYSSSLFLASAEGDVETAESNFASYSRRATPTYREVEALLMAYANIGDLPGLKDTFERLFPDSLEGLTVRHFRPAFYALSRSPIAQHQAMQYWREKIRRANLVPNSSIYSLILQYYATHDGECIALVFQEIRKHGVRINKIVYQNMMTFFARRGEVEPVESLLKCAKSDGVTPDLHFYANLMNAHAEAGSWPGLITTYEFLKTAEVQGGRTIVVENILLKAAHALGIPFDGLKTYLSSLNGETPDAHTYTTLLRAACDNGNMDAAEKLYWETVDRDAVEPGFLRNPHVFSVLISGYLHQGNIQKVLFFCRELDNRGIKPTSVTISQLLMGVTKLPNSKARLLEPIVTKMVHTLHADNKAKGIDAVVTGASLEHIYYPAMRAAIARGKSQGKAVDRLYKQMTALGHEPSLAIQTILLDSFRYRGRVKHVEGLWKAIFRKACAARNKPGHLRTTNLQRGALSHRLCLPFNHYINTLSQTGLHEKIQPAVDLYTQRRFALSPRNYNTLILAYVRAGDLQRAFELYDELLQRCDEFSWGWQPQQRRRFPFRGTGVHMPPLHNAAARARRARYIGRQLLGANLKYPTAQDHSGSSFAQLIGTAAMWGYWRISWPVKRTLRRAVHALKNGYTVIPVPRGVSLGSTLRSRNISIGGQNDTAATSQLGRLKQFPLAWKTIWMKPQKRRLVRQGPREERHHTPKTALGKGGEAMTVEGGPKA